MEHPRQKEVKTRWARFGAFLLKVVLLDVCADGQPGDSAEDRAAMRYALRIARPLWLVSLGGVVTIVAFGAHHGLTSLGQWLRCTAALLALAVASAMVGGMIGFLFGIPRIRNANGSPGSVQTGSRGIETYTHLEEISDWLAKILVGVGLAELSGFPTRLWGIAGILAKELCSCTPAAGTATQPGAAVVCNHQQAFVLFLMLGYGALGLMAGFLFTRLFLRRIYYVADTFSASDLHIVNDSLQVSELAIDAILQDKEKAFESLKPEVQAAVQRLASVRADELTFAEQLRAWAKAQLLRQDFARAVYGFQKAAALAPADAVLKSELARVRTLASRIWQQESLEEAAEAAGSGNAEASASATETLMFSELYEPPPAGFEKVIGRGEGLRTKGQASDLSLVYLIAAYGQKAAWAAEHGQPTFQEEARGKALALSRVVLPRQNEAANLLRYLWTTTNPSDDDLAVFRSDPEFVALFEATP